VSQVVAGLTDVVFGNVMVGCALATSRLNIPRISHRYWPATFWFGALSAYIGVLHHLVFAGNKREADASWALVGIALCLAMSAMLAATATEVLSPRSARTVIRLRAISLTAYAIFAVSGHGNLSYLLAAESITIIGVLTIWGVGQARGHPQATNMLIGIGAMAMATLSFTGPGRGFGEMVGLDSGSLVHVLQIPGMLFIVGCLMLENAGVLRTRAPARVGAA
jgi:hypothetical protein